MTNRIEDLGDLRCVRCGVGALAAASGWPVAADTVVEGALSCRDCGAVYDALWGAVFLGEFERDHVPGLIEVAAQAGTESSDRRSLEALEAELTGYHRAADRAAFVADPAHRTAAAPWFPTRYKEWRQFTLQAEGIDFGGRRVLDVGAGYGFDGYRLAAAGADVTAMDSNPLHLRQGRRSVPEARWIGGYSHVLPFRDGAFDVVCCSAALHHMRDPSAALAEMLRVARPDGIVITTADPYRADTLGVAHELQKFDRNANVLCGTNEGVPPLGAILDPVTRLGTHATVRVLTTWVRPITGPEVWAGGVLGKARRALRRARHRLAGRTGPVDETRWWTLPEARAGLSGTCGSISLRVDLDHPDRSGPAPVQRDGVLRAARLAGWLDSEPVAVAGLSALMDAEHVDLPFPFPAHTKFNLLNGWRLFDPAAEDRPAYCRARWFLTRRDGHAALSLEARGESRARAPDATLAALVDGRVVARTPLEGNRWTRLVVPLASVPVGKVYGCELQVWPDGQPPGRLGGGFTPRLAFRVRRRAFTA